MNLCAVDHLDYLTITHLLLTTLSISPVSPAIAIARGFHDEHTELMRFRVVRLFCKFFENCFLDLVGVDPFVRLALFT